MSRDSSGSFLSAVFVDYDNIYLSLKRKNEAAAKLFAKDCYRWIRALENGRLITSKNADDMPVRRRIVLNRCYGNPVPRRSQTDNSTDMSSFAFVRHHFLNGGFETIDCPPLTAHAKNAADIRMVMDVRDFLTHNTHFDEFILLSSDADFTVLLHRLRAHARRIVVFSNDRTADPYAALSDGDVKEADLIELLLEEMQIEADLQPARIEPQMSLTTIRSDIIAEVTRTVLSASAPQPLEALAERAIRVLGHAKTVGTEWGGAGNFRDLLSQDLPSTVNLTEQAPFFAYDVSRAIARSDQPRLAAPAAAPAAAAAAKAPQEAPPRAAETPAVPIPAQPSEQLAPERAQSLQQSIGLIHQASKAPPLSPPEYRAMFTLLANELTMNKMQGHQTIENVRALARELGIDAKKEDIRFIVDVVGRQDPWFEQGASAVVFASRFRNFVIAQCQEAGMQLAADEIDLIDAWFAGGHPAEARRAEPTGQMKAKLPIAATTPTLAPDAPAIGGAALGARTARWWQETAGSPREGDLEVATGANDTAEEFPRIVRNRLKA